MSKLKYIICAVAIVLMLIVTGVYFGSVPTEKIRLKDTEVPVWSEEMDRELFICDGKTKNMKKVVSSGVLQMYIDEKTLAVCVLDTISGKVWSTLPQSDAGEDTANISINVITGGREYTLSSQTDSVYRGKSSYSIKDDTLTVSYNFCRETQRGKTIDITLPVKFSLSDGALKVKVDCSALSDNSEGKVYVKSIAVLPYFGAYTDGSEGDFMLLPSASGVIVDAHKKPKTFQEISLPVYGEDIAKDCTADSYVPIGTFGMKKGSNAFICLIDKGEALGTIKCRKELKKGGYNRVYSEFEIRANTEQEGRIYLSEETYEGIISLSYRFLSGNNADYITMAGACRELLIRQGRLTDSNTLPTNNYPFNLTVVTKTQESGDTSTADQTVEMLSSVMAKGIGNINLMLTSAEEKDFGKVMDFAVKEKFSLSFTHNLFSYEGKGDKTLTGNRNPSGLSSADITDNVEDMIYTMREDAVGLRLDDCGKILPSSYSKGNVRSRDKLLTEISSLCASLSSHGSLTVSTPNIYTVKYATNIVNLPLKSPLEDNRYCTGVPFLQAVLHGICDYSFTAVNLSDDPNMAMLKAIEYGAVPHYEWYFASMGENDKYCYSNSLSQARLLWENSKAMFSDLRDQRITSHEEVKENLMRTIYSNGTEILVNYGDKAVTVSGITVDPMGFVRVN